MSSASYLLSCLLLTPQQLLNANSDLDQLREELTQRTDALSAAEARLGRLPILEERVSALGEEKNELETQVAGLGQKLRAAEARCGPPCCCCCLLSLCWCLWSVRLSVDSF